MVALEKKPLLELAYHLLDEIEGIGVSLTAVKNVAEIFADIYRSQDSEDKMVRALVMVEALSKSPLARRKMQEQYKALLDVLQIRNGRVQHPDLRALSFEEFAYVLGWLSRLFHARAAGITHAIGQSEKKKKQLRAGSLEGDSLAPWQKKLKELTNKQKA
ncbi:MAG: hypothetical protein ACPLTR_00355 [Thermacetogeniaceae bacterium]